MKKGIMFILIAGGILMIDRGIAQELPRNLLKNSSFQLCSNPGYPDYWAGQSGWRQGTHTLVKECFVSGTLSMKISNHDSKDTTFFSGNYGWSPGVQGTVYTFSVYLKADPSGLIAVIGSDRLDKKQIEVTDQWQLYSITAPLKPGKGYAGRFLQVEITLLKEKKGTLYINAPCLVRSDNPVDYRIATFSDSTTTGRNIHLDPGLIKKALVGEWILGQTEEKNAEGLIVFRDTSGMENHGVCVGNPEWIKTIYGNALSFDGKTCVIIPHNGNLVGSKDEFSVEILLKPNSAKNMPVFIKGMHLGGYALRISHGKYQPIIGSWNFWDFVSDTSVLPQPEHIVISYKLPVLCFFMHGKKIVDCEVEAKLTPEAGRRPFIIGGFDVWTKDRGYHPEPGFEGWIRFVRMYNRALTGDEVEYLYKQISQKGD